MNCYESAKRVSVELLSNNERLAVAESCTGGLISRTATMVVGSSAWFEAGFVTYSDQSKINLLGVSSDTISAHTSISAEAAREMLAGTLSKTSADYVLAVTGLAGPGSLNAPIPVGTVFIGAQARHGQAKVHRLHINLDRAMLQNFTARYAYDLVHEIISNNNCR